MLSSHQKNKLFISSLPSPSILEQFNQLKGVKHLVNVAGVDIGEIYSTSVLSEFTVQQFDFADVFTNGLVVTDFSESDKLDHSLYEKVADSKHRAAFLEAIQSLKKLLESQKPVLVFCHRGLSRSPLVAASALNLWHDEPIAHSIKRVQKIHPPAQFTHLSISAMLWSRVNLA